MGLAQNDRTGGTSTSALARESRRRARVTVVGDARVEVHRDARGSREFVAGRGVDAAIGLSILGEEATLVAVVGDDQDGERIRSVLSDYGVRLVAAPSAGGTARVVVDRRDGAGHVGPDPATIAPQGLPIDDAARRAIAEADLVVVTGFPFPDDAGVDELVAALEGPGVRLVVDGAASARMSRDPAESAARLARLARSALFTTTSAGDPAQPDDTVAAVAHLLAHGDPPGSPGAWDDAFETALAALAAAVRPGRAAGPRPPGAPTDRGS